MKGVEQKSAAKQSKAVPSTPALQDGKKSRIATAEKWSAPELVDLWRPHVESFDFIFGSESKNKLEAPPTSAPASGLDLAVSSMSKVSIDAVPDLKLPAVSLMVENVQISSPMRIKSDSTDARLFPHECRELGVTYDGAVVVNVAVSIAGQPLMRLQRKLGNIPIMVKSSKCHLKHMTGPELLANKEERTEQGGYFIVNGNERIIRLLIVPRRNYVSAIIRPSYTNRGNFYTKFGCSIRCVRPDQSSQTVTLHYLETGSLNVRISLRKNEYFIPAIMLLRGFVEATDKEIYDALVQGNTENTFLTDRAEIMLRESKKIALTNRQAVLKYLGSMFRLVLRVEDSVPDEYVGAQLIRDHIFVHIAGVDEVSNRQKFDLLIFMMKKLLALAQGEIKPDNPDALSSHELLLPGHLYLMYFKEKLQDWLFGVRDIIKKDIKLKPHVVQYKDKYLKSCLDKAPDVCRAITSWITTGNLNSRTGLDLMQVSGYTIVADKLNYFRYISHFRSVHRGQFFTEQKTTTVRKLLPESWGFMCPVHTPDGAPCGLLNHLAYFCQILTHPHYVPFEAIVKVLCGLGMTSNRAPVKVPHEHLVVMLDGVIVGYVPPALAHAFAKELRVLKLTRTETIPRTLEIAAVYDKLDGIYPGIYLFSSPARMVRPVYNLMTSSPRVEYIGAMEQLFLEIACTEDDYREGETTHQEIVPTAMLSVIAGFTPFSDFNQSPRNMYQCQMGKQTMGTPFHSIPYRVDNKFYRLQTPQSPLVRTKTYEQLGIDEYPLGTNAVVAVIAYTGYDMEDAMILNKMSAERGFGHASVYTYKTLDLAEKRERNEPIHDHFWNNKNVDGLSEKKISGTKKSVKRGHNAKYTDNLDWDGLPCGGQKLQEGDPLYTYYNDTQKRFHTIIYKDKDPCFVDEVRILGSTESKDEECQIVGLKLLYNRNPIIGDKFSSRHGQKGVLSVLWPQEDMPFSESGLCPDVIINPNAFPSRMTIGMLVESLAGKAAALHGVFQDGTPFRFNEKERAVDYFGQQLTSAGYAYHGTETLYSGVTGLELTCDIYIGLVYYQRLRHMVSDKWQVRSTGPINNYTRQPIKGRKKHGGIRFGEMERDSLLGHGAAYLLNDRLMNCSDYSTSFVCSLCGSMLSCWTVSPNPEAITSRMKIKCQNCDSSKGCTTVAMPYVFTYLANELAAMNIRLTLDVK